MTTQDEKMKKLEAMECDPKYGLMGVSHPPVRLIFGKIIDCMRDIAAISKGNRNAAQGYNFRGIDDVYNELHPILARHGVFTLANVIEDRTEERTTKSGTVLIYRVLKVVYQFCATDGSSVSCTVIGEGMDSGDKASNKAMAVAHKYALMQIFCIPTKEAKDPEVDSHEVMPKESTEPYSGLDGQRLVLKSIFDALRINTDGEMVRIAKLAQGVPMYKLRAFVEETRHAANK